MEFLFPSSFSSFISFSSSSIIFLMNNNLSALSFSTSRSSSNPHLHIHSHDSDTAAINREIGNAVCWHSAKTSAAFRLFGLCLRSNERSTVEGAACSPLSSVHSVHIAFIGFSYVSEAKLLRIQPNVNSENRFYVMCIHLGQNRSVYANFLLLHSP